MSSEAGRPTRRDLLAAGAGALLAPRLAALPRSEEDQATPSRRSPTSCLFLIADQHRWDVAGYMGDSAAHTPSLDRLAAEGTRLEGLHCQVPLCVPARQSLITLQPGRQHGSLGNEKDWADGQRTLASHLAANGVRTAMIGKSHFNDSEFELVRDERTLLQAFKAQHEGARNAGAWFVGDKQAEYTKRVRAANPDLRPPSSGAPVHHLEESVVSESRRWLGELDKDEPFFLWASFLLPHPPRFPPLQWLDRYREADVPLRGADAEEAELLLSLAPYQRETRERLGLAELTSAQLVNVVRAYYASLAWTDHCVGQVVETLRELGRLDDTLVVYTSDHGEMLGQHGLLGKFAFFEGALRVPGILRLPGQVASGRRVERVMSHLDLMSTVVDLMGVPAMPGASGSSLRPHLSPETSGGEADGPEQGGTLAELYLGTRAEGTVRGNELSLCLREGSLKYVRYAHNLSFQDALYDVLEDPGERRNLAGEPEYAAERDALREQAREYTRGTFEVHSRVRGR